MQGAATLLHDIFGFGEFRPGQEEIVSAVAQGENVLAIMPTGGGKSLCFQLPALMRDGVTVVISPLIALMRDQVRALREAGVGGRCPDIGQYRRGDRGGLAGAGERRVAVAVHGARAAGIGRGAGYAAADRGFHRDQPATASPVMEGLRDHRGAFGSRFRLRPSSELPTLSNWPRFALALMPALLIGLLLADAICAIADDRRSPDRVE